MQRKEGGREERRKQTSWGECQAEVGRDGGRVWHLLNVLCVFGKARQRCQGSNIKSHKHIHLTGASRYENHQILLEI